MNRLYMHKNYKRKFPSENHQEIRKEKFTTELNNNLAMK